MTHRIDPTILRDLDVRGIVGDTFHPEDAYHLGRAFARLAGNTPLRKGQKENGKNDGKERGQGERLRICTGRDGRQSSPSIEHALARGLADSGVDVLQAGMGPSPMLYYATHHQKSDGGIMVTASHNPREYNGLKFMLGGRSLTGAHIARLGTIVADGDYTDPAAPTAKGTIGPVSVFTDYVKRLARDYPKNTLTIAWDPGNGATCEVIKALADRVGGRHIFICDTVDGDFPNHHPDPSIHANLRMLQETVIRQKCDLGIAFDGDGDRVGVIDRNGHIIATDNILALLAGDVVRQQPGATVVVDVKAGPTLRTVLARLGANVIISKTGHSYIKNTLIDRKAAFGGEISSHIFFADSYYGFDDGIYAAIRLLRVMCHHDRSLDALCRDFPRPARIREIRLDCPEDKKFAITRHLINDISTDHHRIDTIDGIGVEGDDYWFLIRPSNTQPAICLLCEAKSDTHLHDIYQRLHTIFAGQGLTLPPLSTVQV